MDEERVGNSLKLLVKSSFIVFIGVFLSKLFTYLYKMIIAREFGPSTYGVFSLALMIIGIIISIASLGLSDGLLRYTSIYRKENELRKARYLIKSVLKLLIPVSILIGIMTYFSAGMIANFFHDTNLILFIQIFSITVPLMVISSVFTPIIRAFEDISRYSFVVNIFSNGIKLLMLGLLIFLGFRDNSVAYSYTLGTVFLVFVSYFACKKYLNKIFSSEELKKSDRMKVISEVFSYSWPIIFLGLITTLYYWIDSFVIGYFGNTTNVGMYNAAFTIVTVFGIVPELFMQLFLPMILGHYSNKNLETVEELSKQVGKWILILNTPLFFIMFLFPGVFINFFFGKEYLLAEGALRILTMGSFLSSLLIPTTMNLMSMVGKSKVIMYNLIFTSVLNLILNILLVPKYGIVGAATATSIVWAIMSIILLIEVKHHLNMIPIRRKIGRILLVSALCCIFLVILRGIFPINLYTIAAMGIVTSILYLALIYITRCFDKYDLMIYEMIKKRVSTNK